MNKWQLSFRQKGEIFCDIDYRISQSPQGMPLAEDSFEMTIQNIHKVKLV